MKVDILKEIENLRYQAQHNRRTHFDELAEYQEQMASWLQELVDTRPPCKVGDVVYFIRNKKIIETKVDKIVLEYRGLHLKLNCNSAYETSCNSIGKTVFFSQEEAEKALKQVENTG